VDTVSQLPYTGGVISPKHLIKTALARLVPSLRLPHYDPTTHKVVSVNDPVLRPEQVIYDPEVFGRYDLKTQRVVPRSEAAEGFDLDSISAEVLAYSRRDPPLSADRYAVTLRELEPGAGLCLDACTPSPRPDVRETVERLGYTYQAIDIRGGEHARQEDLTALTFADGSVARIISCDTLEHIPDYRSAIREMHRVLQPGGMALVHVPVYYFDRPDGEPIRPGIDPWEHVRYHSARELERAFVEAGFVLLSVKLIVHYGAALIVAAKP
jgi:SAM-dependent methyltransferase